ncbi:MAG: class I SAM-dependent methyltransferase [Candidatus Jordarchaeaceae archaeon]
MKRNYQENFFTLYTSFQCHDLRLEKARKISYILTRFCRDDLRMKTCLDVGCSAGVITSYLRPLFKKMVGIDYDPVGMSLITSEQKQEVEFIRGDAMNLPILDESMDVVICAQVYEHVPDDERLFQEIRRVLKPGGIVFFSGPNKLFPIELHHNLPFLQWLPPKWANRYVQLMGKGNEFYEYSRTLGDLRKVLSGFDIYDMTVPVLRFFANERQGIRRLLYLVFSRVPRWIKHLVAWLTPNFNWVLVKKADSQIPNRYTLVEFFE